MSKLNEKAMLVQLSVSQWTARKYDSKATKLVADSNHTSGDIGKFNKLLIQGDEFKCIGKIVNLARAFHYSHTLPWDNNGQRILPIVGFETYRDGMNDFQSQFNTAVNNFVIKYPDLKAVAQRVLNGLYKEADYPQDVASKFNYQVELLPVPDGGDFRVALNDDEISSIADNVTMKVRDAESKAIKDVWQRVYDAVKHAASKLENVDTIFRDSLVDNVKELAEILPMLNINDDPELDDIAKRLTETIGKHSPSALRNYPERRIEVAKDAKALLADIDAQLGLH